MNKVKKIFVTLIGFLVFSIGAFAQTNTATAPTPAPISPPPAAENAAVLEITPQENEKFQALMKAYLNAKTPEQKEALRIKLQQELTPTQREAIKQRMQEKWKAMTPEQKQQVRDKIEKNMTPEQKTEMRAKVKEKLEKMTPEQRRAAMGDKPPTPPRQSHTTQTNTGAHE